MARSYSLKRKFFYVVAFFIILSCLFIGKASADSTSTTQGGRLVTIHDRSQTHVILTHAQTVRDALSDAQIPVVSQDVVEPSLGSRLQGTDYTVNIYRARPVIVVDGAIREKVMTAEQTPEGITAAANIVLQDEDKTTISSSSSSDIVNDGVSVILTIHRAKQFTLQLYGTVITAYSQAATVGEMLKEKSIELTPSDTLSASLGAPLTAGMTVSIWRNGAQTATVEEAIPFPVQQVQDFDQLVGYKQIQTPGVNGQRSVTYQIITRDGKELSRSEIQSVVVTQPKQEVDIIGAGLPPGSHQDWMAAAGISSKDYGFVDYIFMRESHWNPASRNPSGLYVGLGQTSPTTLANTCPNWQGDPICQLKFFNGYALSRYHSWQGAYAFRLANGWW